MCYMFYLGSDYPIPTFEQNPEYPEITVSRPQKSIMVQVKKFVQTQYIYYVGSWQGCGCGFCYEDYTQLVETLTNIPDKGTVDNAQEDWQRGHTSVMSLKNLLSTYTTTGRVYLYVVWAGDEGTPLEHQAVITPSYFSGDYFAVPEERSLFTVQSE